MTTLQIVSDLHIEFKNNDIPDPLTLITPTADILVLAGDIGSVYKYNQLYGFLQKLCPYFKIVIYVPGNHEYYTMKGHAKHNLEFIKKVIYSMQDNILNLYILDKSSIRIGDICIAGCTLWSDPQIEVPKFLVRIHGLTTQRYKDNFNEDLAYIKEMIRLCKASDLKLVIVTHYCPSFRLLTNRRKYPSLYASNLDHLLSKEYVNTWICGHIHKNFDIVTENKTRLVGNQKGKTKDNITDYSLKCVIEIK